MEDGADNFDLPYRSEFSAAIERVIAVTFTILAIFGNTLIISAFCKHKMLRTVPNLLVVNLSLVDTLAAVAAHPLLASVLIRGAWFLGHEACKYQAILNSFLFIISHLSITLVSLNRYFIIVRCKKDTAIFTKRSSRLFLVAMWVFSSCLGLSHLMADEKFEFHANEAVCVIAMENSLTTSIVTVVFVDIVFTATASLNYGIFKSVHKHLHRRQVSFENGTVHVNLAKTDSGEQDKCNSRRRRRRVSIRNEELYIAKKVIIVTSLYTLCWLPQGILKNASLGNVHFPREIWMISTFCMQFSSLLNPVLYGLLNRKFRKVILEMLGIYRLMHVTSSPRTRATDFRTTSLVPTHHSLRATEPFTVEGCDISTQQ